MVYERISICYDIKSSKNELALIETPKTFDPKVESGTIKKTPLKSKAQKQIFIQVLSDGHRYIPVQIFQIVLRVLCANC